MHDEHTESELEQERAHYDLLYSNSSLDEPIPEHVFPKSVRTLWNRYSGSLAGKRVLECGCGNGENSVWLAKQGAFVVGIDLSPIGVEKTIERAKRHGLHDRVTAFCGDVASMDKLIPDDSIDVALGWSVLHHLPPKEFGQSLAKVLRPGGYGLFFENSNANPLYRLGRRIYNNESACGSPLTAEETDILIAAVGSGERIYPLFGLFGFAKKYVFRGNRSFAKVVDTLDNMIDHIPGSRRWSAHMWVFVRKPFQ